jgi:hypothetical protein
VHEIFGEVEWVTIFFFVGLFMVVAGVEHAGLLERLAEALLSATAGDRTVTALVILWASAILSAIIDNIPFVATMIPLIKNMAPSMGGPEALMPLWWALSLGACLGGNGTLVGASANLTVAGLAERGGVPFKFLTYTKLAFPLMLGSVAWPTCTCTSVPALRRDRQAGLWFAGHMHASECERAEVSHPCEQLRGVRPVDGPGAGSQACRHGLVHASGGGGADDDRLLERRAAGRHGHGADVDDADGHGVGE